MAAAVVSTSTLPPLDAACASKEEFDVVIVGGGLSGLVVAAGLEARGVDYVLLEAHPTRLGGRIRNADLSAVFSFLGSSPAGGDGVDVGPAWVWLDHQPEMTALLKDLGVASFRQPGDPGSGRVAGGTYALVEKLAARIDPARVRLGWAVTACAQLGAAGSSSSSSSAAAAALLTAALVVSSSPSGPPSTATVAARKHVVFAAPPRLLSGSVAFVPPLPAAKARAMDASRTWMAGVTKVALLFPERFWPVGAAAVGLSGGGSPTRPAFQCYDGGGALPEDGGGSGGVGCITFFALAPSPASSSSSSSSSLSSLSSTLEEDAALATLCGKQLAAAWAEYGLRSEAARLAAAVESLATAAKEAAKESAKEPALPAVGGTGVAFGGGSGGSGCAAAVQRWPKEAFISDDPHPTGINPHPHPVRELGSGAWGGALLFAGTEAAASSAGVMEGAVVAARAALLAIR